MTDMEHRVTVVETELIGHIRACDRRAEDNTARMASMEAKIDTLIMVLNMGRGARNVLFWLGSAAVSAIGIFAAVKWW